MNFLFTITAHGFKKAADLEEALKKLGIAYQVEQKDPAGMAKKARMTITKIEIAAVMSCIDKHPEWPDIQVAKETGISDSTVNRIRRGLHPLQRKTNVANIKGARKTK